MNNIMSEKELTIRAGWEVNDRCDGAHDAVKTCDRHEGCQSTSRNGDQAGHSRDESIGTSDRNDRCESSDDV